MNQTIWFKYFIRPWYHELHNLVDWPGGLLDCFEDFILFFPLLLSLSWSISALVKLVLYVFRRSNSVNLNETTLPSFSVLIPFYGDGSQAVRSYESLREVTPRPQAIFLIDDGSPVGGGLPKEFLMPSEVTLLRLPQNKGKAAALNAALHLIESEIVVCLDADTTALTKSWSPMLAQFTKNQTLGAITGKIRPRQMKNLVQWMQAIDYLAVICMVKCSESLWGGLTTVSGAWVAYRRQALVETGGWNSKAGAEDIDLSWKLQSSGWRLDYDFNWTANVEMASRWSSLWKQRRRWSCGMAQTLRKQALGIFRPGARHGMISLLTVLGCLWVVSSFGMVFVTLIKLLKGQIGLFHGSEGLLTLGGGAFILQLLVGILIDRGSWQRYPLMILLAFIYPIYFWCILFTSNIAGLYQGFFRRDNGKWHPTSVLEVPKNIRVPKIINSVSILNEINYEFASTETVNSVQQAIPMAKRAQAFIIQMLRIVMLGWSLLCFYSAVNIVLKGNHSAVLYSVGLIQFLIGAMSWFVACLRMPASSRFEKTQPI